MNKEKLVEQKVAKLVAVSLMVRVIVPDVSTDEQIWEVAKPQFISVLHDAGMDNLEFIADDEECPYSEDTENSI